MNCAAQRRHKNVGSGARQLLSLAACWVLACFFGTTYVNATTFVVKPIGQTTFSFRQPFQDTVFDASEVKSLPEHSMIMLRPGSQVKLEIMDTKTQKVKASVVIKRPGQFLLSEDMLKEFEFYNYELKDLPESPDERVPEEFFFPFLILSEAWARGVARIIYDYDLRYLKSKAPAVIKNIYESAAAKNIRQFRLVRPIDNASFFLTGSRVLLSVQWPAEFAGNLNIFLWQEKSVRHLPMATVEEMNRYYFSVEKPGCYNVQVVSVDYLHASDTRRFCVFSHEKKIKDALSAGAGGSTHTIINGGGAGAYLAYYGIAPSQKICRLNVASKQCWSAAAFASNRMLPDGSYFVAGGGSANKEFRLQKSIDYLSVVTDSKPATILIGN